MANYPVPKHIKVRSNERIYETWKWEPGGVPQDFTGWTVECKVRADKNDRNSAELADWQSFVTLNTDPDGAAEDGWIIIEVPQATVAAYTWTVAEGVTGWWDIVVINPSGKPKTLREGSVKIFEGMS